MIILVTLEDKTQIAVLVEDTVDTEKARAAAYFYCYGTDNKADCQTIQALTHVLTVQNTHRILSSSYDRWL